MPGIIIDPERAAMMQHIKTLEHQIKDLKGEMDGAVKLFAALLSKFPEGRAELDIAKDINTVDILNDELSQEPGSTPGKIVFKYVRGQDKAPLVVQGPTMAPAHGGSVPKKSLYVIRGGLTEHKRV